MNEQKEIEVQAAYLSESLPFILGFLREPPPLLSNDLGDIGVRKPWVLSHHYGLVMLPIQDKSCSTFRQLVALVDNG